MPPGGQYYDREVYSSSSAQYSDESNKALSTAKSLNPLCDPKLYSAAPLVCQHANPIVFALDVTGSMGTWSKVLYDKLPMFYGQIMQQGYLEDPAISCCAIGDANSDLAPLQVTPFEQGAQVDKSLSRLWLEGGGGGTYSESYELSAFFYAHRCLMPHAKLPFFFVTGDEAFYERIQPKILSKFLGLSAQSVSSSSDEQDDLTGSQAMVTSSQAVVVGSQPIPSSQVWTALKSKFNVFHLHKEYLEEKKEQKIVAQWVEQLGEHRVLRMRSSKACIDVVLGVIALVSNSRTLDTYLEDMRERGQSAYRLLEVSSVLEPLWNVLCKQEQQEQQQQQQQQVEQLKQLKQQQQQMVEKQASQELIVQPLSHGVQKQSQSQSQQPVAWTLKWFNNLTPEQEESLNYARSRIDDIEGLDNNAQDTQMRTQLRALVSHHSRSRSSQLPRDIFCPLTQEICVDPVIAADGCTYDRAAIEYWLQTSASSPVTGKTLDNKSLTVNNFLRDRIQALLQQK